MNGGFRAGRAHPLVKVLPGAVDPLRLFAALTENGARPPPACSRARTCTASTPSAAWAARRPPCD